MPYNVAVRPLQQPAYRNICVATKKGRTPSLATQRFLEHVASHLEATEAEREDAYEAKRRGMRRLVGIVSLPDDIDVEDIKAKRLARFEF